MSAAIADVGSQATLVELVVADRPEAWAAAGFLVDGDAVALGATRIRLTGADPDDHDPDHDSHQRGITGWTIAAIDAAGLDDGRLDGLPTEVVELDDLDGPARGPIHPNGAVGLDHVVVMTPDLERTTEALGRVGLACRRVRETTSYGSPMRQAFFRLGGTILEVVSGDVGEGLPASEAPAAWFGLAVDVADLDDTAALLGDGLGSVKVAVQDGRRIATFRHKALGLSVAIAAMDDHGDR